MEFDFKISFFRQFIRKNVVIEYNGGADKITDEYGNPLDPFSVSVLSDSNLEENTWDSVFASISSVLKYGFLIAFLMALALLLFTKESDKIWNILDMLQILGLMTYLNFDKPD